MKIGNHHNRPFLFIFVRNIMLTNEDGKELLELARNTVEKYFKNSKLEIRKTRFKERQGVFVTIHNIRGELRGCVGYPRPIISLGEAVQKVSISAAFEDTRFPSLTRRELDEVVFEISVLTKSKLIEVEDSREYLKKIKLGEDGLIVERGFNSGLLLPQVAIEHKLSVEKFLQHTCYKAGLRPDMWLDKQTKIYKFQAQIFRED